LKTGFYTKKIAGIVPSAARLLAGMTPDVPDVERQDPRTCLHCLKNKIQSNINSSSFIIL
jgi:hypothetical protein